MKTLRFLALEEALKRQILEPKENISVPEEFGKCVFNKTQMRRYLSSEAYDGIMQAIEKGVRISRKVADQIALGMKAWAIENGATHYTHWFQPLNEASAEKHDTFFEPDKEGMVIEKFSGDKLVQQEPDASSFPSGGMRSTFEARGYTAWDPSSPAFILGKTLCIPSIFISYNGDALDFKTPFLRSLTAIDKAATKVCSLFFKDVHKVNVTFGWEQEYFLVDEALYFARPDLILTGRTLIGHPSAKDQQLEDHYFASIPERVKAFMQDLEIEAWRLGIPLKTRHNEVSPNQFECASIFEEANLANDHNILLMDIMRKIAERHHFRVLLHEKPFAGINGSGKHCNWSLMASNGVNLLSPGNNLQTNLRFLAFVSIVLKAVYEYNDLLKATIASLGNEHRLGGNEAPPNIISAFLGNTISSILNEIESKVAQNHLSVSEKKALTLDIGKIPEILLDNTDRNRTSPFAFTGNRFEFRAVGSSANPAAALIALNTSVAAKMLEFYDLVKIYQKKGKNKEEAILTAIQKFYSASKDILFDGNGYSKEWHEEAKRRGLSVTNSAVEALAAYIQPKNIQLLESFGILKHHELEARYEIRLEYYVKKLQIESRVLGNLVDNHIIPTALYYQQRLLDIVLKYVQVFQSEEKIDVHKKLIDELNEHISALYSLKVSMEEARKQANMIEDIKEKAFMYSNNVKPYMEKIRYHADKIEMLVDNQDWPLPKYRELLFIR
ncbi:MAG: glutamine synthetase III [Bacteroidales bacterium]|nr:glutamine synthetase III [Bacteroidales bacterium]